MKKVIIFGGTTEGRRLAELLVKAKISCIYCVATEYGKQPVMESDYLRIHEGRMDASAMTELYQQQEPDAIVDATHPFAEIVKEEIANSIFAYDKEVSFFRLARDEEEGLDLSNCYFFNDIEECIRALKNTSGRVFLTTGSKELKAFCEDEALRERVVARVIPSEESLKICYDNGLKGNQIIAMQGPFTAGMNLAFLKECEAQVLVMKEGGKSSGERERIVAANKLGVKVFILKRPEEKMQAMNFSQVKAALFDLFGVKEDTNDITPDKKLAVTLAGFGMGFGSITSEVQTAINQADYIFGASRMLVGIDRNCKKYPYYLAKDIVPVLEQLADEIKFGQKKVVVLFSGDTGFYSGTKRLLAEIEKLSFCSVKVLPGISSISALAAKVNESWQDGKIISTHGVEESKWKPELIEAVSFNEKVFVLTSGVADVRTIGEMLMELSQKNQYKLQIYAAVNLYSNEKIITMGPEKCSSFNEEGLCTLFIKNVNANSKPCAPGLSDDMFIREQVPMSKEEIRELSICKLRPKKNSVIYDIGSGTGSVTVELGLLDASISVYAIELKSEACSLIRKNLAKFNLNNVKVIEGTAPDALEGLPVPTHVFIGGSAGRLEEIIGALKALDNDIRVVINSVTIETSTEIFNVLKKHQIKDADIVQVGVAKAKKAGDYSVMQGQNPVYIVSFKL
ncbi:precorrin-6Y C5,15-methyltransferase (decarboxylating) [Pseudobutyrivibrio sp. YE44]|uniref:precorrin-6A reductase n=1 Tax=Pseudobutyrivibrio sp. YE44 TaxID=1520802 RepID=UPI00087E689C|nr:precorrin-6A reductase [Pseudobutyrivibrio sp. YE44]SDB05927.1 precorrin-6Y C5,15-methyltransferase (decarboxylating) [Pseudobutyrivibrio sp. YE44]